MNNHSSMHDHVETAQIGFVTGNADKIRVFREVFSGIDVSIIPNDRPEIQADNGADIARETALYYARKHGGFVIREDHSLYMHALHPFPGPYVHYFDQHMPMETLLAMLHGAVDRSGFFELNAAIANANGFSKTYSHRVPIQVAMAPSGSHGNFDKILMLQGEDKTFSFKQEQGVPASDVWHHNLNAIRKDLLAGILDR